MVRTHFCHLSEIVEALFGDKASRISLPQHCKSAKDFWYLAAVASVKCENRCGRGTDRLFTVTQAAGRPFCFARSKRKKCEVRKS